MKIQPLVTVGVPVRNGGKFLRVALESVHNQTYKNLQVIISDNCSEDETPAIVAEYLARDPRFIYVRQLQALTAIQNFGFVLGEARGEFFMWAAHDDTRSNDYVETLVDGVSSDASALLAFGDLLTTGVIGQSGTALEFEFSTAGLGWFRRMRKTAFIQCFHIYGVWRTNALKQIPMPTNSWWTDLPLMLTAAKIGHFKYVAGPRFVYYEVPKTALQRAQYQDNKSQFSQLGSIWGLFYSSYIVVASVGGSVAGIWAGWLVLEKQAHRIPGFLIRRFFWFLSLPFKYFRN